MDIFISYKREDRDVAERLAQGLLRYGYDVWWDASLLAGDVFVEEINRQLEVAKIAITLWSKAARDSRWVQAETLAAWNDGKYIGAVIEPDVTLPVPYSSEQYEDLVDFAAGENDLSQIIHIVKARIGPPLQKKIDEDTASEELRASEAEAAIWFKIHNSKDVESFHFYIKQYGENANFFEEAQKKIKSLENPYVLLSHFGGRVLGIMVAIAGIIVAGATLYGVTRPSDNEQLIKMRGEITRLEIAEETALRKIEALQKTIDTKEMEIKNALKERDDAHVSALVAIQSAGKAPAYDFDNPKSSPDEWVIQIGSYSNLRQAEDILEEAKVLRVPYLLNADSVVSRRNQEGVPVYRARFSSLTRSQAEEACQYLAKNKIICFAIKED